MNYDTMKPLIPQVEYAGFRYYIVLGADGRAEMATPVEGQHQAARKDKHRRAAVEKFNAERRP